MSLASFCQGNKIVIGRKFPVFRIFGNDVILWTNGEIRNWDRGYEYTNTCNVTKKQILAICEIDIIIATAVTIDPDLRWRMDFANFQVSQCLTRRNKDK